jgi:hypothetical protein
MILIMASIHGFTPETGGDAHIHATQHFAYLTYFRTKAAPGWAPTAIKSLESGDPALGGPLGRTPRVLAAVDAAR